ncbi:MAG TPA: aldo/keto reductase [Candidatus Binataceae bacterium]|nr:aldo/keto reductase [Candidatus Binataceae bacterium]
MATPPARATTTFVIGGDLTVHRLGFGAMRVTGAGVWGQPKDPVEAKLLLRRVISLGVDLIDTADSYGPEVSEQLIAEALHPYPADLVIATKGGFTRPGPGRWHPDGRPSHLKQACEGSLRRLRLERIDLYQLHTVDDRVPFEESVGALAELQSAGKIRHVGLSNVSAAQLKQARSIVPIVSVQNLYNLSDRSSEGVIAACERDGLGFIPWYPLAAGSLLNRRGTLARIAARHQATPSQVALAWLLQHSPAILPIPGTSSIPHLEENVAALEVTLDADDLRSLDTF